ncbi:MAG: DUF4910 domain-containing protein, partial [Candidatus Hodarchaeota archaeon]
MLPEDLVESVNRRVSGIRACDFVNSISQFHRIQGSKGFLDAIHQMKSEIDTISDVKTEVFEFPADGKSQVGTWTAPFGWFPKSGTLELIDPEKEMLADFSADPISVVVHSRSGEVEGEVIDVGKGLNPKELAEMDIKGKIVLTESRAMMVHRPLIVEGEVAAILTFVPPSGIDEIASLRRYDAFWPKAGEEKKPGLGFSLRQTDGVKIRNWIKEGKTVRVKGKVDAEVKAGKLGVLSAVIEGEDASKEFWLIAHVCHPHPGSNDNASGSASLMEAIRVISSMIQEGIISKPEISLRFLWVPEWSGTIELMDKKKDLLKRCKGVLNMDMV